MENKSSSDREIFLPEPRSLSKRRTGKIRTGVKLVISILTLILLSFTTYSVEYLKSCLEQMATGSSRAAVSSRTSPLTLTPPSNPPSITTSDTSTNTGTNTTKLCSLLRGSPSHPALRIRSCRPNPHALPTNITIYLYTYPLWVFPGEEAAAFAHFARSCLHALPPSSCPIRPPHPAFSSSSSCPLVARFTSIVYLCFSSDRNIQFISFNGRRLNRSYTHSLFQAIDRYMAASN